MSEEDNQSDLLEVDALPTGIWPCQHLHTPMFSVHTRVIGNKLGHCQLLQGMPECGGEERRKEGEGRYVRRRRKISGGRVELMRKVYSGSSDFSPLE